jgi:nucleotide-binding universal stress UspA family protein
VVEFKHVLCAVDLSELSLRALAYANAIATWYDARLTVLHVVPTFEPMEVRAGGLFDPVQIIQPVPREEVLEQLRQTLDTAGVPAARAALTAEAGEVVATIVGQCVERHCDLLVMGTHGRSGFDRLLLGSVTEKLLRKSSCPVLTVPPHAPKPGPTAVTVGHILCAVDFSPASLQAFGFAAGLAHRSKAPLTLLHSIEWLAEEEPRETASFSVPEFREELATNAREQLNALVAPDPVTGLHVKTVVAFGRAHREILAGASEAGADLIIMGAQGRGGHLLPAFGSTTNHVVRASTCPVLTVHAAVKVEEAVPD